MGLNRREFVVLAAVTCAGCKMGEGAFSGPPITMTVDAGPVSLYSAEGVYNSLRNEGFFLVNEGGSLFAVSSVCTHRSCKLSTTAEHTFHCKCHGSRFDAEGKVTKGPATRDLPHFPVVVNESHNVMVQVTRPKFEEE